MSGRGRALLWAFGLLAAGCTPEIGDKCILSTDCSIRGDKQCDISQPDGYCTQINCSGNSCANDALCVLFGAKVPGCGFDDRAGPRGSRVSKSFCVARCETVADCRGGYVCADPRTAPWEARVLDDNPAGLGCLVSPRPAAVASQPPPADGGICKGAPDAAAPIDASAPTLDGGVRLPPLVPTLDAGVDAGDGG